MNQKLTTKTETPKPSEDQPEPISPELVLPEPVSDEEELPTTCETCLSSRQWVTPQGPTLLAHHPFYACTNTESSKSGSWHTPDQSCEYHAMSEESISRYRQKTEATKNPPKIVQPGVLGRRHKRKIVH